MTTFLARLNRSLAAIAPLVALASSPAGEVDFNRDVRSILADKCFRCHGPDAEHREADLRLDKEEDAKAARDGNSAIVPGKPDESLLIQRILAEDETERMPPVESGKSLSPEEIATLKRWIGEGAKWALPWAYVPPKRETPPEVKHTAWPLNWVDRFVLARLEAEGLKPSPEADKVTLIRRLSIDLVGLPPTPAEVDVFVADDDPQAYERLVNRLLASPRFGERMASYWLDLVRYADTVGYHGDQEHQISAYREYVIDALNRNLPFDQFTREQLAGDLLPGSTRGQKIASGYNRVLQTSHEGGVQAKEYLAIYAADHVRNLSNVWMGATMGCAQCHNHKFDPYTMADFYKMAAFFADVDEAQHLKRGADISPTLRAPEMELLTDQEADEVAALEAKLAELKKQVAEASQDDAGKKRIAEWKDEIKATEKKLADTHKRSRKTMITVSIEPREMRILPRGNWLDDSGPVIQPAVPEFLGTLETGGKRATRLDLANWLTDSRHGVGGLTARVMANRFWYLCFGAGLSRSLDDFGGQGEAPSHPELLDALAVEYVESGWDTKHLLKLLVTSRAYRQASIDSPALRERDPLNRLLARQARYRYPAEAVRDTALAISGLLVERIGGESARPYQPAGYYRHLNFPEREYQAHHDDRQWRRGVYMHWQRQYLHPMLKAFDAPSREECTAARPRSNTPVAALVLLNDPTFVEASRGLAERILREGGDTPQSRLDFAFRQAASRLPTDEERAALEALQVQGTEYYAAHADDADKLLHVGIRPMATDLARDELASWTVVARVVLNMSETVTRQ